MKKGWISLAPCMLAFLLLFTSCRKESITDEQKEILTKLLSWGKNGKATVSVYATGLNNPRGLRFASDGTLYVAEGGTGGTNSTVGLCPEEQVPPPVGPYHGSPTGARIS